MRTSSHKQLTTSPTARINAGREAIRNFEKSAKEPTVNEFIHYIQTHYPLRARRMRADAKWLRKQAAKHGVNPDQVMRTL